MQSLPDLGARIKAQLIEKIDEVAAYITTAVDKGSSAHEVETNLWWKTLDFGHNMMGAYLNSLGDGDEGERVTVANGKLLNRLEHRHIKRYLTVFGEYEIPRVVYGTREGQKIQYVPLDARVQFPEAKFSYLLQDWDQSLAMDLPFNQVNGIVSKILGFKQSVNSLERTDRKLSESVSGYWEQVEVPPADEQGAIVVVSADSKGVVMRNSELEQNQKTDDAHPGNKKMSLVGAVYTIDPYVRTTEDVLAALFHDQRDERDLPVRPKPLHKYVRAALLRDEQGKTNPQSAAIFGWLSNQASQRNPRGKKPLVLIMDGQESLWNSGLEYLPENEFDVVEILDLLHALSYVWTGVHLFFPKKSKQAEAYARKLIQRVLDNDVTGVIETLRRKGRYEKLTGDSLDELNKVCGYLTNQAAYMNYKDYLEQGYPIASGVIEGACRNVVKDRMEHSGMRWVMKGAHAMLSLRSIHLSGLWDEFIAFHIQQETLRLYPQVAANDHSFSLNMAA